MLKGLYCSFVLLCSLNLLAKNNISLGKVIVTTTRDKFETGDVSPEESSSFYSIITKDRFEAKFENISQIIEKESSIQVRQTGGLGSFSSVSLRGSSSSQVMIFMDGVLLNEASGAGIDISSISLSDVEAIEIYRGITPINFGKASIGGVINIRTKRSEKGFKGSVTTGYGSFNTWRFSPFINHKPGKFDYIIGGDYLSSKNNFEFLNDNGTTWNTSDDRLEKRNNSEFSQYSILTKIGYDFTKDLRIVFSNQYFSKDQNLPNWNNNENIKTDLSTLRDIANIKMIINDIGSLHLNTASRLDYLYKREEYDDREGKIGLGKQHNRYRTTIYGYNQFLEWPTEYNILTTVLDIRRENYRIEDLLNYQIYSPSSRNTYALSVEDSIILLSNKIIISPALRYQYLIDKLKSSINVLGVPISSREESKGYLSPKIGLRYNIYKWITLKTNIAQYIREPSFFELFGDRGFFTGNDDLRAEKGINFDIGAEFSLNSISFNIAYFRSNVDDVISYIYNARGIGSAVNISKSYINGVELGFNTGFLRYLSLSGNYTYQSAVNKGVIQAFDGKKLPGRFEHSFFTKLEAKWNFLKIYYETSYDSGLYYDSANLLKAPIKREHGIGTSLLLNKLTINFDIKNIGNNLYEDFNGYPQPGRSYWTTIKYSF